MNLITQSNLEKEIFSYGKLKLFKIDNLILSEEETKNNAYLIISGKIKVSRINIETGKEQTISILRTGDIYDIISIFKPTMFDRNNIVTTLEDTQLLELPIELVKKWIFSNPEFSEFFFNYTAEYIASLENLTEDLSLEKTYSRLMKLIIESFNPDSKKFRILDNLNHEEIASLVGTVRAVVNRDLQKMKEEGLISIERKKIKLNDNFIES